MTEGLRPEKALNIKACPEILPERLHFLSTSVTVRKNRERTEYAMHDHTHDHNCGCDHEHEEDPYYITLYLDDGTEEECIVIGFFEADGRDYIALLPAEEAESGEGEPYLYRYSETDEPEPQPILDVIESDEEYEIVVDAFEEFLDSIEAEEEGIDLYFGDEDDDN